MTTDPDLAGDVVQEAYARAWQRWAKVSGLEDPAAWVRTIAWRVAVSHFRRAAVARRRLTRLDRGLQTRPHDESDIRLDVEAALRRLTAEHRRVLVLHEMVGLTVLQLADETGVAEGTVKSRLSRARAHLVTALGIDYPTAVDEPPVSGEVTRWASTSTPCSVMSPTGRSGSACPTPPLYGVPATAVPAVGNSRPWSVWS